MYYSRFTISLFRAVLDAFRAMTNYRLKIPLEILRGIFKFYEMMLYYNPAAVFAIFCNAFDILSIDFSVSFKW